MPDIADVQAEELARVFHRHYEEQAGVHGWDISQAAVGRSWEELPQANRMTMIATCRAVIDELGVTWEGHGGFPTTVPAGWYAELNEEYPDGDPTVHPSDRPHRWRVVAANGQAIAADEVFYDRANARRSVRKAFPGIPIRGE